MIGFAVIVGAFVSKPATIDAATLLLGFVTGFAICGYSMVINDYYDIEVDRVNQPDRPLPSGAISSWPNTSSPGRNLPAPSPTASITPADRRRG